MTELTLQNHRRTISILYQLALSAVITGVALWAALSSSCCRRGGSQRPDPLAILLGM